MTNHRAFEMIMARLQLKQKCILGIGFFIFIFLCCILVKLDVMEECKIVPGTYHPLPIYLRAIDDRGDSDIAVLQTNLMKQRNALSKQLNELSKRSGQKDCENKKDTDLHTSSQGGWCRNESREVSAGHVTDMDLVLALSAFLAGKKVASFGDGPGVYKREILKLGKVLIYDAYDGAPYTEETSEGRVVYLDLTSPQFGLPLYDWVMSLEVAEHIPPKFENAYMDNIARHCREGIILSWATPGQGGYAHINEKHFDYVNKLLQRYDFEWDEKASYYLRNASKVFWLRENVSVFRRKSDKYLNLLEHWYL